MDESQDLSDLPPPPPPRRSGLPLWARIGLLVLALAAVMIAVGAVVDPYTNGRGGPCNPIWRGGSTPSGQRAVMEGAHAACDLKRTDRGLIIVVALQAAAIAVVVAFVIGRKRPAAHVAR